MTVIDEAFWMGRFEIKPQYSRQLHQGIFLPRGQVRDVLCNLRGKGCGSSATSRGLNVVPLERHPVHRSDGLHGSTHDRMTAEKVFRILNGRDPIVADVHIRNDPVRSIVLLES